MPPIKVIGVTQGSNFSVFLQLMELLKQQEIISDAVAYVADSMAFQALHKNEPGSLDSDMKLLREWEITTKGRKRAPDWARLREYEKTLGDPVFWNALLADRRIFFGYRCKSRQDYKSRFSYEEMGGILLTAIEQIEAFISATQPGLIIGFGTSTIGDYVFYLFAQSRGIPYLQLKATKINNRVAFNDDVVALSSHIQKTYFSSEPLPEWAMNEARSYIAAVKMRGIRYEGAIQTKRRFSLKDNIKAVLTGLAVDMRRLRNKETREDNHVESMFLNHFHERFRNPFRNWLIARQLGKQVLDFAEIKKLSDFAFYPLHFEPEVSLQVFGRPFQNQIELARTLAASLPAGMLLLVKEHPRARGYRSMNYYRKLLEIPNLRLVDSRLPTYVLVQRARLVAVVSGSTGLEAVICERPVVTFGIPVYNILHGNMLHHAGDLNNLAWDIQQLLQNYRYDERRLCQYIGSTIMGSAPVDLYTALLGKPGRVQEGREYMSKDARRRADYDLLASYCRDRIAEVTNTNYGEALRQESD